MAPKFHEMHPALIIRTVLVGISLILIPYLSYRFFILRQHFFIEGRSPKLTIIASISMLITTLTLCGVTYFEYFLQGDEQILWSYNFVGAVGQGFAFVFCALIIFRTYLVYDQWRTSQMKLKNISKILTKETSSSKELNSIKDRQDKFTFNKGARAVSKSKVYRFIVVYIIIIFAISTGLYYRRDPLDLMIMILIWVVTWGVGIFIIIKTRKTKEVCHYIICPSNITINNNPFLI